MHLFMLFFANSEQASIYQYVEFVYSVGFNIFLWRWVVDFVYFRMVFSSFDVSFYVSNIKNAISFWWFYLVFKMQLDRLRNEHITQPNALIPYFEAYLIALCFS